MWEGLRSRLYTLPLRIATTGDGSLLLIIFSIRTPIFSCPKGLGWPKEWSFSHNRKKAIHPALPCCCFLFSCVVEALLSKGSARKDTDPFSHCWVRRKQRLGRFWGTMMAVRAWLLDVLNPLQEMQCWFWSDETVGCLTPPWFYSPLGETNNGAPPLAVHVAVAYLKSCHVCQLMELS
jgi:hypothetical protein